MFSVAELENGSTILRTVTTGKARIVAMHSTRSLLNVEEPQHCAGAYLSRFGRMAETARGTFADYHTLRARSSLMAQDDLVVAAIGLSNSSVS